MAAAPPVSIDIRAPECIVCRCIMLDAMIADPCGHGICGICYQLMPDQNTCPTCRATVKTYAPDHLTRELVQDTRFADARVEREREALRYQTDYSFELAAQARLVPDYQLYSSSLSRLDTNLLALHHLRTYNTPDHGFDDLGGFCERYNVEITRIEARANPDTSYIALLMGCVWLHSHGRDFVYIINKMTIE